MYTPLSLPTEVAEDDLVHTYTQRFEITAVDTDLGLVVRHFLSGQLCAQSIPAFSLLFAAGSQNEHLILSSQHVRASPLCTVNRI